jgi:putative ABC transport system permease protein
LGATARVVRQQVVTQGAKVVLIGVVLGVAAGLATTRLMGALLYEVEAVDPAAFAAMSVLMIGVGLVASYMPARRASRVHPVEALRTE